MTQAALQFDAHTLLLGLLGMVCGFLAYWGTRLEQRVDELKARQCLLAEEMHKSYVPREDCRERTAQILGGLERADEKLDRIAGRDPYRGALTCAESAGTPPSFRTPLPGHRRNAGNGPGRTSPSSGGRIFRIIASSGGIPGFTNGWIRNCPAWRTRPKACGWRLRPARGGQEHVRFAVFRAVGRADRAQALHFDHSRCAGAGRVAVGCGQGRTWSSTRR